MAAQTGTGSPAPPGYSAWTVTCRPIRSSATRQPETSESRRPRPAPRSTRVAAGSLGHGLLAAGRPLSSPPPGVPLKTSSDAERCNNRSAREDVAMNPKLLGPALMLMFFGFAPTVEALNENTTIVLHARDGIAGCDEPQKNGLDCVNGRPALDIEGMQLPSVYVMLRNYDGLRGLQCAFDWPLEWTYIGGIWDCRP